MMAIEPSRHLLGRAWFGLESCYAIRDPFVVDRCNRCGGIDLGRAASILCSSKAEQQRQRQEQRDDEHPRNSGKAESGESIERRQPGRPKSAALGA